MSVYTDRTAGEPHLPRILPSSIEAEQGLLGAILLNNRIYRLVSDFLLPEHFSHAVHQKMFAAMGALIERGAAATPAMLVGTCDVERDYWRQLADAVVNPLNAEDYGRRISRLYVQRLLLDFGGDITEQVSRNDVDDIDAKIAGFEDRLRQIGSAMPSTSHDVTLLSLDNWLTRDLPEPTRYLGDFVTNAVRILIVGPTGLGKTNFGLALAYAVADGQGFLHWQGSGKPCRVLYIDGEMSRRLMKARVEDALRRHGGEPKTLYLLSREDFPEMPPLNTVAGRRFVDKFIERLGGIDLVIFDNIQALIAGDMKEEEPWQEVLPWIRKLTARDIGQVWFHHTGYDQTHGYGTKTREWQLDVVVLMGDVERPGADIAFSLRFQKARMRTPENRADFAETVITLSDDEWVSSPAVNGTTKPTVGATKRPPPHDRMLELLEDELARSGTVPPASAHIPPKTPCITEELWRRGCALGCISEGSTEAQSKAFRRGAKRLIDDHKIGKWERWVWIVRR